MFRLLSLLPSSRWYKGLNYRVQRSDLTRVLALSVCALKFPKTEIQPSINNFPHLTFWTHSSPKCSPIRDSYITIDGLQIPHTICFRPLKIHMKHLCIVLCLLILTRCVVDEPAQFHFPFSSVTPPVFLAFILSTLNLLWLYLWDCNDWLNWLLFFKLWTDSGKATCRHPFNKWE